MKQSKNKSFNWHLVGLLPIATVVYCYILNTVNHVSLWQYFWVCPVVAILTGCVLLSHNKFGISAVILWIVLGPVIAILFNTRELLELWHVHHFLSAVALFFILYNIKEIWNEKGFVFGLTSYYAYMATTSYLSKGEINMVASWFGLSILELYLGILFTALSVVILLWNNFEDKTSR